MAKYGKKSSTIQAARLPTPRLPTPRLSTRRKPESDPVTQTAQQQRAAFAFEKVSALAGQGEDKASRFRAYANALPALVQMTGIGQAMAFVYSKKSGQGAEAAGWAALYQLVSDWLCASERKIFTENSTDLMQAIISHEQNCYRLAQAECQALLVWVRQFARALLRGGDKGEQQ